MSQPGNYGVYLTGIHACDAARLTGLPIYCRPRLRGFEDPVDPNAADEAIQRGAWRPDDVVMDLLRLPYWDQMKVAWARIGAYAYLDAGDCRLAA